ncbi:MAG: type I secretion system permease/ATPase, partial [Alphaproteobacteria bacterium]|nr:type I secretion system permease/ATPase [Alphaproteobacteria bacterium]
MTQQPGSSRKRADTPLKRAFASARWGFVAIGVFSFFLNLLMLVTPLYMMQVFDRVLASGRTETLLWLTLIAGFALLVLGLLEVVRNRVLTRISTWLDRTLSGDLIRSALRSRLGGVPIGAQPLRDLQNLRGFVGGSSVFPLFDSPWVPVFVAVIWLMHPWLGALALGAAVVLFVLALANDLLTRRALTEANQLTVGAQAKAEAGIRNADVVQAMGLMPGLLRDFDSANDRALGFQERAGDRAGTIVGLSKFVRLFVQVAILGLGAFLVLGDQLTAGGMIAASILLGRCLAPVEQAIGAWRQLVGARTAWRRLDTLLAA